MSDDINEVIGISEKESEKEYKEENTILGFNKMISRTLIKVFYLFGVVAITTLGIFAITEGFKPYKQDDSDFLIGLSIIVFGNIFWRMICEGWIVIFSLHDTAVSILEELKKANNKS